MNQKATDKPRRLPIAPEVSFQPRGADLDSLAAMASRDPATFMARVQEAIDTRDAGGDRLLHWGNVRSVAGLFDKLADIQVPAQVNIAGRTRAIQASAFPALAGAMTIAGINDAYAGVPTIGEQLVTDVQNKKRTAIYAAVHTLDTNVPRVDEGEDFPEVGGGQEKYEIRNLRNGRRISITAETIEEDDTGSVVEKVNQLGTIAGEIIEEQTLRRVCDIDGSATSPAEPYVLHLNGAAASLYSTSVTTLVRAHASGTRYTTNALVDETDLENARQRLNGMKNERGKRISNPMSQCVLLVPDALLGTAQRIVNSELVPGVENEHNPWGPRGAHRPSLVSSSKLDDLSTSAWYLGNFKKQFKRKWKLAFEYVGLTGTTESFLRSRLAFQARLAWDCEVGAVDYVYVVQSLTSTTAP